MKTKLLILLAFLCAQSSFSFSNPAHSNTIKNKAQTNFRNNCDPPRAHKDMAVNTIRARLLSGGDMWWDGDNAGLIIPNVKAGEKEVAAIFAAAVWMGGVDEGGNLKVAAQTYGGPNRNDYWPGPLRSSRDENPGTTDAEVCRNWDQIFSVSRAEIDEHLDKYGQAAYNGATYAIDQVPQNVLGWPAKGNPFFALVHGFDLPLSDAGLADFWDEDGDGLYNPLKGDFPELSLRVCGRIPTPDEINFWIFNDNGNIHSQTQGNPLQMEFQVEAFAYSTDDQLNRTLFQKYKLINRAIEPLDSAYFALWVDPQLGCRSDDYIGCDPERSLTYIYNANAVDGLPGCECLDETINAYCDGIPIVGIDLIRGPLGPKKIAPDGSLQNPALGEIADTIVELGMSSFTYYLAGGDPPPGMTDPGNALEYYRHMTGTWRDGSPFEYGGEGYQEGTYEISYAFSDPPNDTLGWSMCTSGTNGGPNPMTGINRFVQSSGPFRFDPGGVNEILIGLTWVPDQEHPCPDISDIQAASDYIEKAISNCFDSDYVAGPAAPDVDIVELDRELVLILSNDSVITSNNNAKELYQEIVTDHLCLDSTVTDSFYRFEGYKIFQLAGPDVALIPKNTDNPDLARLVAQVDVKNGIGKIFNWKKIEPDDPFSGASYYTPVLMVDGRDEGIRHTFRITEDAFAEGDRRLINHKKYYYAAVAYAYNEFKPFDPLATVPGGQDKSYLEGRRNVGYKGYGKPYTAIPRPITDQMLNTNFGDGAVITRLDGLGTGNNFLDISKETRQLLEEAFAVDEPFTGNLVYADGQGPIDVQIFNPLDIVDATFELKFVDSQQDDEVLQTGAHWELTHIENPAFRIVSEKNIDDLNEQLIRKYGFSITVGQVSETGSTEDQQNGFIGYDIEIGEDGENWLSFIPEGTDFSSFDNDDYLFDYLMTSPGQIDDDLDPNGGLSQFGQFAFMPYYLLAYEERVFGGDPAFLGPVHAQRSIGAITRLANLPEDLNNIDIVFTPNKNLWSRCVIVETANRFYEDLVVNTQAYILNGEEVAATQFDLRPVPSVGKETDANGLPVPDGATDENGNPLYGLGWFPGYAIDVETGQRLNIFFGENSVYDGSTLTSSYTQKPTGGDMMFNPTSEIFLNGLGIDNLPLPYVMGGHHCVYVTKDPYDGCANYIEPLRRKSANDNELRKLKVLSQIGWAGLLLTESGTAMLSYDEGLIPTETRVRLRVNNPYQVEIDNDDIDGDQRTGTGENNYHPKYQFSFNGKAAIPVEESAQNEILDAINIVPNPYYAYSDYETSLAEGIVKITNLPNKCTVTIYSLDGRFVRQFNRNEGLNLQSEYSEVLRYKQGNPDLEWDLKNVNGTAIGSGVYLIHVKVDGVGERTLKWFGVGRKKKDF